jgi:hypothetical protein
MKFFFDLGGSMKKFLMAMILTLALAVPALAAYHAVHIADDMVDPKTASYAFIGFYFDQLPIIDMRDDKDNPIEEKYFEQAKDKEREKDFPDMLAKVSHDMKFQCDPVTLTEAQKTAITKNLFTQVTVDPKLVAKFAGDHPYVLVGIIDRYGIAKGTVQVQVREKEKGPDGKEQKIDYLGKRSTLETHDAEEFNMGFGRTASLTLVAFSAKDGHVVWQANDSRSIQFVFLNSPKDVAKGCMENIFHNLNDVWKRNQHDKEEAAKKEKERLEKEAKKK